MIELDPLSIYDRGLDDLSLLHGYERLVFMLQDFDNLMEMEGWEHFFLYESHFAWYGEMKQWLQAIGDEASLAVLSDFERHLAARGVELAPTALEASFETQPKHDSREEPDWCDRYSALREERWAQAVDYLQSQGVRIHL